MEGREGERKGGRKERKRKWWSIWRNLQINFLCLLGSFIDSPSGERLTRQVASVAPLQDARGLFDWALRQDTRGEGALVFPRSLATLLLSMLGPQRALPLSLLPTVSSTTSLTPSSRHMALPPFLCSSFKAGTGP